MSFFHNDLTALPGTDGTSLQHPKWCDLFSCVVDGNDIAHRRELGSLPLMEGGTESKKRLTVELGRVDERREDGLHIGRDELLMHDGRTGHDIAVDPAAMLGLFTWLNLGASAPKAA